MPGFHGTSGLFDPGASARRAAALLSLTLRCPFSGLTGQAPAPEPGTLFLHAERFERRDGSLAEADRGVLFVSAVRSRHGVPAVDGST